jgi:hypothetical protein
VTATERFKMLYATAVEQVCVLQAELESARARIVELENEKNEASTQPDPETRRP